MASTERLVASTSSYYYSDGSKPDTYLLTQQGGFEGWFYSPFEISDMASRGHELLVASDDHGTIARLDLDGGLVGLINTPASQIGGVAVASNGDLFVSEDNSNQILRLNSAGNFLDMTFLSQPVDAMGIDSQDRLVFAVLHDPNNTYNSLLDIVFYDFDLGQVVTTVATQCRTILGLDFSDTNEILVAGSTSSYGSTTISRLGLNGQVLGNILGPSNVSAITLVSSPEPSTALLIGFGLVFFAARRRA